MFRFGRWAFQSEDTHQGLGKLYAEVPEDVDILITHQPPHGQGDSNTADQRCGSLMLLDRVMEVQPSLHIFGHIHTGHGMSADPCLPTLFVNCAICDENYKPVQKPILVTLSN